MIFIVISRWMLISGCGLPLIFVSAYVYILCLWTKKIFESYFRDQASRMQYWKEVNVWSSTVYSCDFHEGRQHFITTLLMFSLGYPDLPPYWRASSRKKEGLGNKL